MLKFYKISLVSACSLNSPSFGYIDSDGYANHYFVVDSISGRNKEYINTGAWQDYFTSDCPFTDESCERMMEEGCGREKTGSSYKRYYGI